MAAMAAACTQRRSRGEPQRALRATHFVRRNIDNIAGDQLRGIWRGDIWCSLKTRLTSRMLAGDHSGRRPRMRAATVRSRRRALRQRPLGEGAADTLAVLRTLQEQYQERSRGEQRDRAIEKMKAELQEVLAAASRPLNSGLTETLADTREKAAVPSHASSSENVTPAHVLRMASRFKRGRSRQG